MLLAVRCAVEGVVCTVGGVEGVEGVEGVVPEEHSASLAHPQALLFSSSSGTANVTARERASAFGCLSLCVVFVSVSSGRVAEW